jgi:hypothetical protein
MYGVGFGYGAIGATTVLKSGVATDADAQSYFTANSTLTDATQKNAINQFVLDLKSNSLWTLGKYLYLGFLGDSTKVKYNLFAPSSNVLTLSSGWTYDSQGMQGNGTSAYAQTGFIPNTSATQNSKSLFVYSQTDSDQLGADIGNDNTIYQDHLLPKFSGNMYARLSFNGWQTLTNAGTSKGLQLVSRTSSTVTKGYNKTTLLGTDTSASNGQSTVQDYLGAYNGNGTPTWYSSRKISIYGRMDGLDATQEANLNTCINTLLTTLSIPTW